VALGILRKLGMRAEAVADGAEAVKALQSIDYDLVFMDVQMPVMNGYEATRAIRDPLSGVMNQRVPIIAMTAHAMEGDREKCLNAGMNDYIPKPVSAHTLADVLAKWLPARPNPSETRPEQPAAEASMQKDAVIFDRQAFMERMMGDEELVRAAISVFLEDMPRQIDALEKYLVAGDATDAGRQAHTIKGAAANLGGEALKAVAARIEQLIKSREIKTAQQQGNELKEEFFKLTAVKQKNTATSVCHAYASNHTV